MEDETTGAPVKRKESLNAVRSPVMLLFVLAWAVGRTPIAPFWTGLLVLAALLAIAAWLFGGRAIRLALGWDPRQALAGALLGALLFGLFFGALLLARRMPLEEAARVYGWLADVQSRSGGIPAAVWALIGAAILAPADALFWRGFVQRRLVDRLGRAAGIAIAQVAYAGFWVVLLNPLVAAGALAAGLVLGVLTERTGSLLPSAVGQAVLLVLCLTLLPLF